MANRQDSGGSTHSRSTSSQRSASTKQVEQPEPQVIIETKAIDPPARATLRRIFTLFLVIGLLRLLFLKVLLPWTVDPYGTDPTELRCVINHKTATHPGFLYCNRDCVPRLHNQEKITAFNEVHPLAVNYTIQRPNVFGQSNEVLHFCSRAGPRLAAIETSSSASVSGSDSGKAIVTVFGLCWHKAIVLSKLQSPFSLARHRSCCIDMPESTTAVIRRRMQTYWKPPMVLMDTLASTSTLTTNLPPSWHHAPDLESLLSGL